MSGTDRAELANKLLQLADVLQAAYGTTVTWNSAHAIDTCRQAATALSAEGGARAKSLSNVDVLTPVEFSDKRIQRALNLVVEHARYFSRKLYFDQPMGDTKVMLADSCNQLFEARVAAKSTPAPQAPGENDGMRAIIVASLDELIGTGNTPSILTGRGREEIADAVLKSGAFNRLSSADLIAAAKAEERERCAKIADEYAQKAMGVFEHGMALRIKVAIRSAGGSDDI